MISKGPCPECASSDAYALYSDGHGKCYSCGYFKPPSRGEHKLIKETTPTKPSASRGTGKVQPIPESFAALADRGISAKTAAKYEVTYEEDVSSKYVHIYPYTRGNRHVANKGRLRKEKGFIMQGDTGNLDLFAQSRFPAGSARSITITEGECDAMAAYEMNGGFPVVSVSSAANALRDVKNNFEYLNSFDEIVVCFDKDEPKVNPKTQVVSYPGQEAALKVAEALPVGKVRILTLSEFKDPNDYLQAGQGRAFVKEWFNAPKFTPASLKSGKKLWKDVMTVPKHETISYPFDGLNKKTYGMRLSELVIVNAQQKIGKSTILGEITHHILKSTEEAGIGIMRLEETNRDSALNLMSIEANKRLHLPDVWEECSKAEIKRYFDATVNTDRIVMWDHFGSNSIDMVLAQIRNMYALGCKYIILDHLSIIVSDQSGDERKQLDELATKLKTLCMELNICVLAVVHQNRQGEIRGTAGIGQLANVVIRLDRDKEAKDDYVRNTTEVTVTDNRFCGDTGLACYLHYDSETGRLSEVDEDEYVAKKAGWSTPAAQTVPDEWT